MVKKSILFLDALAFFTIIFAPALFVPAYFFDKEVSTVAIIDGEQSFVIMTVEKAKWGNVLFPILILLVIYNFCLLFVFVKKRIKINRNKGTSEHFKPDDDQ